MEEQSGDWADREDAELVRASLDGQVDAFNTLVERYQRKAASLAYRFLNNREDAMEVTQDAFLKAYDKLRTLDRPERFRSWLLRVVSNLALNRRRRRALRKTTSLDAGPGDERSIEATLPDEHVAMPEQTASAGELNSRIERALAQLPDKQRQALVLFSIEKMPQKEVAKVLECSVEAVKWNVFAARKKLKDELSDYL
jgi:RNA polymerase sigma-70 factor (ECF subfamily)